MRLLLDTHVALWAILGDRRLGSRAQTLIADPGNSVAISAASLWEIAIKFALRRGKPSDMPIGAAEALGYFNQAGYEFLAISEGHAVAVESLEPLHFDPFDRMLVAQALYEPMTLLTRDPMVKAYGDAIQMI